MVSARVAGGQATPANGSTGPGAPAGGNPATVTGIEVARIRETLRYLIELSGLSRREVEKRLLAEGCGTDLGRLLSGRLGLKLRHILDICRVIDMYPQELFGIVFKEAHQRSPLLQRLDALTGANRVPEVARGPGPRPAATELDQMNRRLGEILRRLEALTPGQDRSHAAGPVAGRGGRE